MSILTINILFEIQALRIPTWIVGCQRNLLFHLQPQSLTETTTTTILLNRSIYIFKSSNLIIFDNNSTVLV